MKSGIITILICMSLLGSFFMQAGAQTAEDLQAKIEQRNRDIANLEKEIEAYQKEIEALGSQATSLSSTIKSLELNRKKLEKDITLTQEKIAAKTLDVERLSSQISNKETNIVDNRRIIFKAFSEMNQLYDRSLPELLLASNSVAQAWDSLDQLGSFQDRLYRRIDTLNNDKAVLETNKNAEERARKELSELNDNLRSKRSIIVTTAAEQSALLKETNQSEATYKKLLAQKKAQAAAFQEEISQYESELNLLINPDLIPKTGAGILKWPLAKVHITQYFGNTDFATANPQIYNGKGHTGVDFRASIGTPVMSALSGTVAGVGNTDLVRGCYSYGKWVMVQHPNGLSTLYAHLSLQNVSKGDKVGTGQILGYSGNTGYSTGPHLHFGVYASEGVQIRRFDNSINCKGAIIPAADWSAYLNPLSYL